MYHSQRLRQSEDEQRRNLATRCTVKKSHLQQGVLSQEHEAIYHNIYSYTSIYTQCKLGTSVLSTADASCCSAHIAAS